MHLYNYKKIASLSEVAPFLKYINIYVCMFIFTGVILNIYFKKLLTYVLLNGSLINFELFFKHNEGQDHGI